MTDQTKEAWTPGPWDKENIGYVRKDGVLHPPEPDQTRQPGESWLDMRARIEPELAAREAECRANINLRRAAPELAEAVLAAKRLLENINEFGLVTDSEFFDHAWDSIDGALSKARGES